MSSTEMPSKHDILGEHLFAKIEEMEPKYPTAKITGMLLDGGDDKVMKMLQEPSYLLDSVAKAVKLLEGQNDAKLPICDGVRENSAAVACPELCDSLYEKISELEPQLCSQITGMLAELDTQTVSQLMASSEMLKNAVLKAKEAFLKSMESSNNDSFVTAECNNNKETDLSEQGDFLYSRVSKVFPEHAAEITGMLLELDKPQLENLLTEPQSLQICIQKAYDALKEYTNPA